MIVKRSSSSSHYYQNLITKKFPRWWMWLLAGAGFILQSLRYISSLNLSNYYNYDTVIHSPPKDWQDSIDVNSSRSSPRIILDGSHVHKFTGGPEAMIQLGLAFQSFLPYGKVFWEGNMTQGGVHPTIFHEKYKMEYGDAPGAIPWIRGQDLQVGDMLILPEVKQCPVVLIKKGVHVYNWHLALGWKPDLASKMEKSKQRGCKVVSHNFYIGALEKLPRENILRPFISPSMVVPKEEIVPLEKKENLILIDDDTPAHVKDAIFDHCVHLGCEAILVKGFKQTDLPALYDRAKIVLDWCMVGSERMPIEAGLRGALLVSSPCFCVQDPRDFPIPKRNIVKNENDALKEAMNRIFNNYEQEFAEYEEFRELYRTLGLKTLAAEAEAFYYSISH